MCVCFSAISTALCTDGRHFDNDDLSQMVIEESREILSPGYELTLMWP